MNPNSGHKENILVADDTPKMLLLMEGYLRAFGCSSVSTVPSARAAFEFLANDLDSLSDQSTDLILMDVNMPGVDGIEACRRIKTDVDYADIQIIMVSAATDTEHLVGAFDAGAMDYITKPINKLEMEVRVRSALTLKHAMDSEKRTNAVLYGKNQELQDALTKVKQLKGLLPICSSRKKIRDDSGYWSSVEGYISQHSDADFSHAVCPECIRKIDPTISQDIIDELSGE
jgi:DNA-binding response OmpR family regulator